MCAKQGTEAGIDAYLDRVLEVMGNAATEPLGNPQPSVGGLIGGEAAKLRAALEDADPQHRLVDPLAARAAQYALATLETNGRMGVIVATPTAGSAGVLPGVLLALRDERGFSHDQLREGILTAAGLGYLIARNASVSGAEGGCQAEVGSAAAMAAAAAVALAGGAPDRCLPPART
ncbi:MAG: L-serine ammonia-lyase, iron-sulfur-dependent, subunit beta [Adlercreutzia equolifaciens]